MIGVKASYKHSRSPASSMTTCGMVLPPYT
jgi:hypothetical protein